MLIAGKPKSYVMIYIQEDEYIDDTCINDIINYVSVKDFSILMTKNENDMFSLEIMKMFDQKKNSFELF